VELGEAQLQAADAAAGVAVGFGEQREFIQREPLRENLGHGEVTLQGPDAMGAHVHADLLLFPAQLGADLRGRRAFKSAFFALTQAQQQAQPGRHHD